MARGGYRKPSGGPSVSGPGKFSKRTDGQPVRSEGLERSDVQYGDRQMIEQGQRTSPIAGAQGAQVQRRMSGSVPTRGGLPSFILNGESANPNEPATAGLPIGPGAGPEVLSAGEPPDDIREVVLDYLANTFQNPTAIKHLADLRAERSAVQPAVAAPMPIGPALEATPEAQPPA